VLKFWTALNVALGLRALLLTLTFILTARLLSPSEFGYIVAIVALSSIAAPLCSFGFDYLLVQRHAQTRRPDKPLFSLYFLITFFLGFGIALLVSTISSWLIDGLSFSLALLVALTECVFLRLVELCARYHQGLDQAYHYSLIRVVTPLLRLALILLTWALFSEFGIVHWSSANLVAGSIAVLFCAKGKLTLILSGRGVIESLLSGLHFVWGAVAHRVSADWDKLVLTRFVDPSQVGVYGAAYKIAEIMHIPGQALTAATTSKCYALFHEAPREGLKFLLRLSLGIFFIGFSISAAIYFFADLVFIILGEGYAASADVLRVICLLPLLLGLRALGSLGLHSLSLQKLNSYCLLVVSIVNVVALSLTVPTYGWRAAAWCTLICEGVAVMLVYMALFRSVRKSE
jgi:O-antigen/teichoic acid export membrane protein